MQPLIELTRVWQLDSCYQPGWAVGREPYHAAALSTYSPECDSWTAAISQAGLEEGSPTMQLLKELTREWQLDSCYQQDVLKIKPYDAAAEETHQSVAARQLLSARLGWRRGALPCSCLKYSPECGSWTAAISQAGLARGMEPYHAAA
jgi:hypothetical protein